MEAGAGPIAVAAGALREVTGSYDAAWYASGALCAAATLVAPAIRRRPEAAAVPPSVA